MTATVLAVVPLNRAVQYDGTNSADIDAAIPDLTIVSETGGLLTIESNGGQHAAPVGGYFLYNSTGVVYDGITSASFEDTYQVIPEPATVAALEEDLASLPPALGAIGAATFGAIGPSQNAVVPVTLTPAMPDTDYTIGTPVIFGGTNLGALTIVSTTVVDTDTVNVTINNGGLVSLGASVLVAVTPN